VIFSLFIWRLLIKQSARIALGSVMILCSINAIIASAADYPTKTIQIINPFPPGAVTDIVARIVAPKLSLARTPLRHWQAEPPARSDVC